MQEKTRKHLYYLKNRTKLLAQTKKYKKKHPEVQRRASKKWHKNHPEYQKGWVKQHRKRIREIAKNYYQNHKEYEKKRTKNYRQEHPNLYKECDKRKRLNHPEIHKKHNAKHRNLGFVPLNKSFEGSEGHHIDFECVVFIPKELHISIPHNVWTGQNMEMINDKAFEWLELSMEILTKPL